LTTALAAELFNADYGAYGILVVFIFYFCRGRPRSLVLWFSVAAAINMSTALLDAWAKSMTLTLERNVIFALLGGFALFALIPILIYSRTREKGYSSQFLQYFFYAFYPAHMLILALFR
jgi:hypothetical protein